MTDLQLPDQLKLSVTGGVAFEKRQQEEEEDEDAESKCDEENDSNVMGERGEAEETEEAQEEKEGKQAQQTSRSSAESENAPTGSRAGSFGAERTAVWPLALVAAVATVGVAAFVWLKQR